MSRRRRPLARLALAATAALAAIVVGACSLGGTTAPEQIEIGRLFGEGRRILFIGNSLTYFNDLPLIVQALVNAGDGEPIAVAMVAYPDYNLEDHMVGGAAARELSKGGWSVVVLQQGPSSVEENRQQLIASTRTFDDAVKAGGARTALFAVWPQANRRQDFPRASQSYALAAEAVDGILFPVGLAWLAAWQRDPQLPLYLSDGLHPSTYGSYLAALVMYQQLTGRSPVGLPSELTLLSGAKLSIPPSAAALMQEAAAQANSPVIPSGAGAR